MIIILKREDLPTARRDRDVSALKLESFDLWPYLIDQAELIAFVEGSEVKFLKQCEDIQSKEDWEILMSYITSPPPTKAGRIPYSVSPTRRKKKKSGDGASSETG